LNSFSSLNDFTIAMFSSISTITPTNFFLFARLLLPLGYIT
jgi:hypothetical protein